MRRGDLLLLALLLALTLPFAGKAFTIDDPTVLAVARQIRADPLAPYSFTINWDDPQGHDQPGFTINNPPLVYAYYAAVTAVAGESEVTLHLAGLVFPATALLAMVWLGRRFARGGVGPAVALLGASGFLVLAHNIMLDVPLVALILAALALFIGGVDADDPRRLWAGALLVAAVCLTKYTGLYVIPLAGAYVALQRKPRHLLYLLLPVGLFGAWCLHNQLVYGFLHFVSSSSILSRAGTVFPNRIASVLICMGGALAFPPALAVWLAMERRRAKLLLGALAAALIIVYAWAPQGMSRYGPWERAACWLLCGLGAALVTLVVADGIAGWRRADDKGRDRAFLALWAFAALAFNLSLTVSAARYAMVAWPPLVLLLWPESFGSSSRRLVMRFVLATSVVWALVIAVTDAERSGLSRSFAREQVAAIRAQDPRAKIWFSGHWGFQYYMQQAGGVVPTQERLPQPGEWLLTARTASYVKLPPGLSERLRLQHERKFRGRLPILLMNPSAHAGFYSDGWGVLPYTFSRAPVEEFSVRRVVAP